MSPEPGLNDDAGMQAIRRDPADDARLRSSAHELQRAAGSLQSHASGAAAVAGLETTLAHVEEALDRLSIGMLKMADAVTESCGDSGHAPDESVLPPEARALQFHLRTTAAALRVPQDGCTSSRTWTRRLLEVGPCHS
jgi:hypothetical protein